MCGINSGGDHALDEFSQEYDKFSQYRLEFVEKCQDREENAKNNPGVFQNQ